MPHQLSDEIRYLVFRYLEQHPDATQRELARHLGVSVGKVNYCLRALAEKGWLKMRNFRDSRNKLSYTYILTPSGIAEKVNVTYAFLRRKIAEYDVLSAEIEQLTQEVAASGIHRIEP